MTTEVVTLERSTMYLRGVEAELVREAKAVAARQGITLTALVSRALEREIQSSPRLPHRLSEIAQDIAWYEKNKRSLLEGYEGRHLAIANQQVVDHDVDLEALAARVADRFGSRSVFMPLCQATHRVVDVRSPRKAG